MLSMNSIFLRLLGTFYREVGDTKHNKFIDEVYSRLLLNRYKDIMLKIIYSNQKSTLFNGVHIGYIKAADIDVQKKTITVRDLSQGVVEQYNFISFGLLEPENIYIVPSDGARKQVSDEVIQKIASFNLNEILILYGTVGVPQKAMQVWIDGYQHSEYRFIKDLLPIAIEGLSEYVLYKQESRAKIETIFDILLGAIYSKSDSETVQEIDNEYVVTDKNIYHINEVNKNRVVVKVGEKLQYLSPITKIVRIDNTLSKLTEITKITNFLKTRSISAENIKFLKRLSLEYAKRSLIIDIPPDILISIPQPILSTIISVSKSFSMAIQPSSTFREDMKINAVQGDRWIYSSLYIAKARTYSKLELKPKSHKETISQIEKTASLYSSTTEGYVAPKEKMSGELSSKEDVAIIEKAVDIIRSNIIITAKDSDKKEAIKTSVSIVKEKNIGGLALTDVNMINLQDKVDEIKQASVTYTDTVTAKEQHIMNINALVISRIIANEKQKYRISRITRNIHATDKLLGFASIKTKGISITTIEGQSLLSYMDRVHSQDSIQIQYSTAEGIKTSSVSQSLGHVKGVQATISSDSGGLLQETVETALLSDKIIVESDNTLD